MKKSTIKKFGEAFPYINDVHRKGVQRWVKSADGFLLSGLPADQYGDRSDAIGKQFGRLKTDSRFDGRYVRHSIRKTVATLLDKAGVPENVAANIIGHNHPTMTFGTYSGGSTLATTRKALAKLKYPGM